MSSYGENHTFRCSYCRYRQRVEIGGAHGATAPIRRPRARLPAAARDDLLDPAVGHALLETFEQLPGSSLLVQPPTADELYLALDAARCPSCGRRNRRVVLRAWLRTVASGVLAAVVVVVAIIAVVLLRGLLAGAMDGLSAAKLLSEPDVRKMFVLLLVFAAFFGLLVGFLRRPNWRSLDRHVRFLEAEPEGTAYRGLNDR